MKLEGRRSLRNLPPSLSEGVVVTAPANGDCFFHLVCLGLKERFADISVDKKNKSTSDTKYAQPSPLLKKRKLNDSANNKVETSNELEQEVRSSTIGQSPPTALDYLSVASLRSLVASEYSEEVFKLMVTAGQIPCTARTIPTFDQFKEKLLNDRAFADEHSIGIISLKFSIAFLILDDNIGGRPTLYWHSNDAANQSCDSKDIPSHLLPKHFITLRLGRQHYSGIRFNDNLLHDSNNLHPQIREFWATQLENIL